MNGIVFTHLAIFPSLSGFAYQTREDRGEDAPDNHSEGKQFEKEGVWIFRLFFSEPASHNSPLPQKLCAQAVRDHLKSSAIVRIYPGQTHGFCRYSNYADVKGAI